MERTLQVVWKDDSNILSIGVIFEFAFISIRKTLWDSKSISSNLFTYTLLSVTLYSLFFLLCVD